jgi:metal-responsive CopG/Arc/MetJ family transcriptional regulator
MSKNPRLFKKPIRLIVNVEADTVKQIDELMRRRRYHSHGNRAEFVRQAIESELARCKSDD